MKKVYQRIDDPRHGDCFKCAICTLLGIDYDDVPNYVDCGDDWYIEAQKTFKEHGYNLTGMELWNPKVMYLENPTVNVFEDKEAHVPSTFIALKREMGINGLFLASVYSPKYQMRLSILSTICIAYFVTLISISCLTHSPNMPKS